MSLDSPTPDNGHHHGMGHNFGDILSRVMPLEDHHKAGNGMANGQRQEVSAELANVTGFIF